MKTALLKTLFSSLAYLALALACLMQWNGPNVWLRVDYFSGGYLALRLLGSVYSIVSSLDAFRSKPLRQEWWGAKSAAGPQLVMFLMALDLLVFLDYGHWRLFSWLERPAVQAGGLCLYLGVTLSQIWTDAYLARHFGGDRSESVPIDRGPYRFVRHPRYAAAIVGKIAFALIFASGFAWLMAVGWGFVLLRKMEIEEAHLETQFGDKYQAYARRTAKVLPGMY